MKPDYDRPYHWFIYVPLLGWLFAFYRFNVTYRALMKPTFKGMDSREWDEEWQAFDDTVRAFICTVVTSLLVMVIHALLS